MSDEIVIGSDLRAHYLAAARGCDLYCSEVERPFPFEYYEDPCTILEEQFNGLHLIMGVQYWNGSGKITESFGPQKCAIWDYLAFLLSMNAQKPLSGTDKVLRYRDGDIHVRYGKSGKETLSPDHIFVTQPHHLQDVPGAMQVGEQKLVVDWVKYTGPHINLNICYGNDDFVSEVHFFRGPRNRKRAVAISKLDEEQLNHPEYTRIFAARLLSKRFEDREFESMERNIRTKRTYETKDSENVCYASYPPLRSIEDMTPALQQWHHLGNMSDGFHTMIPYENYTS